MALALSLQIFAPWNSHIRYICRSTYIVTDDILTEAYNLCYMAEKTLKSKKRNYLDTNFHGTLIQAFYNLSALPLSLAFLAGSRSKRRSWACLRTLQRCFLWIPPLPARGKASRPSSRSTAPGCIIYTSQRSVLLELIPAALEQIASPKRHSRRL